MISRFIFAHKMDTETEPEHEPEVKTGLNEEQLQVIEETDNGNNILLTGSAGVGKSYTIKHIIERNAGKKIGLCAMTGCAAILIDGTTLHSFLGIGLADGNSESIARRVFGRKKILQIILTLDMLIIDEVSMLSNDLFDKVSQILSILRKCPKPFGGVQIILVGDLFQLSPIDRNSSYCFLSRHWDECNIKTFLLKTNMRQKEAEFQQMLERLRWGICSDDDYNTLLKLKKTKFPDDIIPTRLYSKNSDVDEINKREMTKLLEKQSEELGESTGGGTGSVVFTIRYPSKNAENRKLAKKWAVDIAKIPEKLELCINAQVMLTYNVNIKAGLVNGARGYITGFLNNCVLVKFMNGLETYVNYTSAKMANTNEIEITYIPLKLAWAISIHKSQGMTIDALEVDLGESIFANGQAYTALSRAKSMRSVKITNLNRSSFKTSPAVIAFYNDLR